ncbi:MAG: MarR family winged helix-turn-helix transcriptional regulator [Hyphomicrobiaceae bacterium]
MDITRKDCGEILECQKSISRGPAKMIKINESAQPESITHLLHRACQVADSIFNDEARRSGLTTRQFAVLVAVANHKDISQTGLVQITGIDRSTIAEIVKRLLKRGLIRRRRTKADARAYAVRLTDEGTVLLTDVQPAATRAEERLSAALSGINHIEFNRVLSDLVASFPEVR